ncbi:MAG: CDP-diacylglycerol--glycerol-3-phosphate 3-phosphatidyltransferase [Oscillospiraceae bacterium]|nr:CDP-diacylglycerol--glycerol-3-phosphate 3-phosphatidyltransferase [Oscillospiraceae bacterium]MDE5884561.1 CDP-diacylglycerol--glycerol-3-phosphate 3-phosphatidyltransferase [Oscillospiraceae bacterium]
MNLPNKLTLLRILLVPVFLVCMYCNFSWHFTAALILYAIASITDALDGKIARKYNLITTFGKFADPLADKILVLAAFAALADTTAYPFPVNGIVITIIAAREFMVSGLRLVTAEKGVVVAAGIWGKLKTAFTMIAIAMMLLWLAAWECFSNGSEAWFAAGGLMGIVFHILVWISVLLTIISGGIYLKGYWNYIDMK